MPKKTETPDVAEAFITKRRRAYPSLYWTDEDVLLWLLSVTAHDAVWDKDGNIKVLTEREENMKDSFTDEGWEYMYNASNGRMRTSWMEPAHSSPLVTVPDNISEAWERKISSLCYHVGKIRDEAMRAWIATHYEFQSIGSTYKQGETERNYEAFLKVKAALALTAQRLVDLRQAKWAAEQAQREPLQVVAGVTVHHRGFASTETAVVVSVNSMPTGTNEVDMVAILDRPLRKSLVIRVADLKPLTHPPAK